MVSCFRIVYSDQRPRSRNFIAHGVGVHSLNSVIAACDPDAAEFPPVRCHSRSRYRLISKRDGLWSPRRSARIAAV